MMNKTPSMTRRRLRPWQVLALIQRLPSFLRAVFGLLRDSRVSAGSKALFLGALLFIVSPFDVPNFVPILGELSDLMLALLACRWFLSQCPVELVAEHSGNRRSDRSKAPGRDKLDALAVYSR
jgi:uncharacterized membrane protein YkvA (DUF1232 family)